MLKVLVQRNSINTPKRKRVPLTEMRLELRGTIEQDTFSRPEDTHRWYFKVNVVKEEEYPREVSRRSSAVEVSKVARRSAGDLGITEEAIPVITIGLRHAFLVAHLAWPLSRCAVQNGIFYVCESAATIRRKCISEIAGHGCSVLFFFFFLPSKRESRTQSLPSLFPPDCF